MFRLLLFLQDTSENEGVVDKVIEGAKDGGNWLFNAGLAGTFTVLILVSIIFWRLWVNGQRRWDDREKELREEHEAEVKCLRKQAREDREALIKLVVEKDAKLEELNARCLSEVKDIMMQSHAQNVDFTTTLHGISDTLKSVERELDSRRE